MLWDLIFSEYESKEHRKFLKYRFTE